VLTSYQFILAFINMSPWLIALAFDVLYYVSRCLWYYVPIYGGRAQGEARPRAPSLPDSKRRRTLSLTAIMSAASRDQVRDDHKGMRQRHAKTLGSDEDIIEEGQEQNRDQS
jgi:hypothetical protein